GATDPEGTIDTSDDMIPDFAQHGTAQRGVDVTAPGVSVTSLRVPNGFVDQNVTTGKVGTRFQRASGTSQSTAVVSGLAALLVSKFPNATPDQIKALLEASAVKIGTTKGNDHAFTGAGSASLGDIANSALKDVLALIKNILVPDTTGTGNGSLENARGTYHVSSNGVPLTGEQDIFGHTWYPNLMALATKLRVSWVGGVWNGTQWTNAPGLFGSSAWTPATWTGTDWSGARWSGARWTDSSWDGARWSGARWSGARWTDGSWDGARWSGARWSDGAWD
ncbi:MAG TPA: S8 family serine peptidase, partial [Ilumatobacteraceae bacterium]